MTLSCSRSTGSITTSVKLCAVAVAGVLLAVEVDDLPAQPVELIEQRLLDVVALVESDLVRGLVGAHCVRHLRLTQKGGYAPIARE